ncbi:MAG: hypothetical protein WC529_08030 [Candidatus Margulisiibacteriota bacterium]
MSELALNIGIANSGKEYAVRKPQSGPKPQEEGTLASQAARESGMEWLENEKGEVRLSRQVNESEALLTTSTTNTAARVARSAVTSQELIGELRNKFKKAFVTAYSNVFSHNRLLAKVSEWLVGNVMERLALMGISIAELEELKSQVRSDLVDQNHTAMAQVVYDETMLEILT